MTELGSCILQRTQIPRVGQPGKPLHNILTTLHVTREEAFLFRGTADNEAEITREFETRDVATNASTWNVCRPHGLLAIGAVVQLLLHTTGTVPEAVAKRRCVAGVDAAALPTRARQVE